MPWSSLANNQIVSDTNLKDAVDTGVLPAGTTAFPSPTQNKGVTKARCLDYIAANNLTSPSFAVKAGNQLITKVDVYQPGNFILDPQYGKFFTSMSGTNLPSFTYNVTSLTTRSFNSAIPAQNIFVNLSGNSFLGSEPLRVSLYVNSVLVQSVTIDINGPTSATLTLPNDVEPYNEIKISVNSGSVPPPSGNFTFGNNPVNCVAVSKDTGQYQLAAIGLWEYGSYIGGTGFAKLATKGSYLCYSNDYGATWYKSNIVGTFSNLAISKSGQYAIAASQNGYLYRSVNYGATWTAVTSLGKRIWSGAAMEDVTNIMYVCSRKEWYKPGFTDSSGKVFKSTNNGGTWTDVTPDPNDDYTSIGVYKSNIVGADENVIVGLVSDNATFPQFYRSYSGGINWSFGAMGPQGLKDKSDLYDIKYDSGTVVAAFNSLDMDGPNTRSRLYKSDNLSSWQEIQSDAAGLYLAVALNEWYRSYVVHLPLTNASYYSFNPGYLEEIVNVSAPVSVVTGGGSRLWQCVDIDNFIGANRYILAGTTSGLYRSNDGGSTFTLL